MRSPRILLVEDNAEYALKVMSDLSHDFYIDQVKNISEAMSYIQRKAPDLILLDIGLGAENGFDLALNLKSLGESQVPVIYLTGKAGSSDRMMGYTLGAEDYIQKPIDPIELRIRINNVLSRKKSDQVTVFERLGIKVDLLKRRATMKLNGEIQELNLSPTEFNILVFFVRHEGHALSRNQILDSVWGQKLNVSDRAIDAHIFSLRKKLDKNSYLIESVFGIGYRFSDARPGC